MTPRDTYALLRAFVDELARCGTRWACTSPGSRNTPLLLSLVRDGRIRCVSHLDERCAGFFALGVGKATGVPAAVTCTSGTAAAHLVPAVHEAHEARVPLVVLTADRPPELREVGAGQVIDQIKLYGSAAKWFFEVGTHTATPERLRWMRALACRAFWTATQGRPGPVHLNFPLPEPLVLDEALPDDPTGRPDGRPYVDRVASAPGDAGALVEAVAAARRGAIVLGRVEDGGETAHHAQALAAAAGMVLLADPLSRGRITGTVAHYDSLLRVDRFAEAHRPDLVVRAGDLPTSKPLRRWLASLTDVPQVGLDPHAAWQDPSAALSTVLDVDPAAALAAAARGARPGDPDWPTAWAEADARAAAALEQALGDALTEPRVVVELARGLPRGATLFVGSSMPVRDVETFWPLRDYPPRLLANRGANGIDGHVSTPFGIAAATDGPVVALIGDVALLHDVGGLLAARRSPASVTFVVLNNDGGGIFHFLPVANERDAFEEHVATPHGLDLSRVAAAYDVAHRRPSDPASFAADLDAAFSGEGTTIVEVRTDRRENVALHRRAHEAVARALASP